MISLKDKITNESILTSTNAGGRTRIESWLKSIGIEDYEIADNLSITINDKKPIQIVGNIPDYVQIEYATMVILAEATSLKGLPKNCWILKIWRCTFDDFTELPTEKCYSFRVDSCNFKSLKGIPKECEMIIIGNNEYHFKKKDIKKLVNTDPSEIYTLGHTYGVDNRIKYRSECNDIVLGISDVAYCEDELKKLEKLYKSYIPEMKYLIGNPKEQWTVIYFKLDFLNKEDHPHHISDNSIYLSFKYDIHNYSLELSGTGHLNLTDEDRKGKYKYYALKGFDSPYIDNGGKKFRKCRIDDFNAEEIFNKTKDWIRSVVDAALKDQGGELKR